MSTIKELRDQLKENEARWAVNEKLLNDFDIDKIRKYTTGGLTEKLIISKEIEPIDFKKLFAIQPNNPFILERRLAHDIVPESLVKKELRLGSTPELQPGEGEVPLGGPAPVIVDWRNRFTWPWITSIRNQNGCEACWVFGSVALVEAMVRIEHCVWPWISEGDVHKGMGAKCCDCGNPGAALDWMKNNGAADPGCFPWPVTPSGCTGCSGSGGAPYDNVAYKPTADRSGRSVRIPAYTNIGSVADQKKWLDAVGPIVTGFTVWTDFFYYGSGVYHKQAMVGNKPNKIEGGHIMLIVGYDDTKGCWIVKNSWGTGWGQAGFGLIGYGEAGIDSWAKIGLQGTNPDPWTKRRMHNGCMIESGNGALHRNFEMCSTNLGHQIRTWWRDNSAAGFPWNQGMLFGNDAASFPTLISTTYNRNFELVYCTTLHHLHHWWFDQSTKKWNDGGVFGPTDAAGVPGFIQGNYNAPGNFEGVVRTADSKLLHWWRDGAGWHNGVRFASNVAHSGATLIQSHYGTKGNFELVCVLNTGQMQHWWRDNDHGMVWNAGPVFGTGATGSPCMIEGQFGASDEKKVGNFELCVAAAGKVQHWWRANGSDMLWRQSATFGHDVGFVVALVEGSYGFNLEVIVLRTDNKLQHYWRDDGATWHEGVIIGTA